MRLLHWLRWRLLPQPGEACPGCKVGTLREQNAGFAGVFFVCDRCDSERPPSLRND